MGSLARRLVDTTDAERRRLERALHDGAQQRLVALTATLALAQRRLEAGEEGGAELLEQAGAEAKLCLDDLRDLAREIYPAVLVERGLASALNDLARRAASPVEVIDAPEPRLPEAVEVTAYLVASSALADLGEQGEASVRATFENSLLLLEVGGGKLSGEQLEALGDRVGALGGRLEASAAPGGPPFVRATLPVD